MEHLGIALKALFNKQDGDTILKSAGFIEPSKGNHIHLDSEIGESQITQLLEKEEPRDYSIDQLIMTGQVVLSKWMVEDDNHLPLQFTKYDSVFNTLLHFSSRVLTIKDGDPICRYSALLRWHKLTTQLSEDLFTTSYLASRDIVTKFSRRFFDWDAYLGHDCKEVNAIFQKEMAELHMHLKGSSYNFDISWIYLMNHIEDMQQVFDETTKERKGTTWDENLYDKVRKAAAIRYYLAGVVGCVSKTISKSELSDIINCNKKKGREQSYIEQSKEINFQELLNESHRLSANRSTKYYPESKLILDYITVEHHYKESVTNLIMSSERMLMYKLFYKIYSSGVEIDKDLATLFYAYIVFKDYYRHTILQLNNRVGFSNFANYEELKTSFIGKEYYNLLFKAAFEGFCEDHKNNRYIEARIVPDDTPEDIIESLTEIYNSIDQEIHDRCSIIFHFIKRRDESYKGDKAIRNNDLREEVKRKAYAIYKFRQSGNPMVGHVVGIDAANSEIYARPEVFAQAFRFLRGHDMWMGDSDKPNDLNFTYHVGEDFLDLADGLRAIEEAIIYLGLGNGDRLGHALALGTDVRSYYKKRRDTICESKQIILDNLAWLHHKCVRLMGYTPLCGYLEEMFHKYFVNVYGIHSSLDNEFDVIFEENKELKDLDDINDYYLSWLLRGNSPSFGKDYSEESRRKIKDEVDIQWLNASINHHKGCEMALRNANARELFDRYHSREMAKKEGAVDTFTVRPIYRDDYYALLEMIQDDLLNKIERKHIAIECNPTSNYKIGEMERYDQHPIVKYFNYGLNTPYKTHNIAVSINTDDQGVFATSLEREYSLMALALENNELGGCNNSPRAVIEWLDRVRQMSVEQRFSN